MKMNRFSWITICLLALAITIVSCSDDDPDPTPPQQGGDNPDNPDAGGEEPGDLFVLSHSVFGTDVNTSYVTTVTDLDNTSVEFETSDLSQFVEFSGVGTVHALPEQKVAYYYSGEDATVTELLFADDNTVSLGREVSFAGLGVTNANFGSKLHVANDKAFVFSRQTSELIVWNPEDMSIIESKPLGITVPAGDNLIQGDFFTVDGKAVLITGLVDENFLARRQGVNVTVIDIATNNVDSTTTDDRTTFMSSSAIDANGNRYFGPNDNTSGQHFLTPDDSAKPVILRMLAGQTSFDPDWSYDPTDDLGSVLWGCCTQGADGNIFIQSFPEDGEGVAEVQQNFEFGAFPFDWYDFDTSGPSVSTANTNAKGIPFGGAIPAGGEGYLVIWDDVNSRLLRTTAPGGPQDGIAKVPGFIYNIVKVR
ncbi:MxcI protein [Croceitalea dokdonensis DOKDO 023]|uniref:MxcI protein n=1 Tax=Croceitalea dokdonensis DOKDO 023 TaxID=1300341 RepID=A0A0P7AFU8_9FLAO|nr:hypothetical protein [Croceitalea dokdonensis]KPM32233.1 MxcI protein [Croceitalea dokdonensis DOKDO 023]